MRPTHCKALLDEFDKSLPAIPPSQLGLADESASRAEKITKRRGKLLPLLLGGMSMEQGPCSP